MPDPLPRAYWASRGVEVRTADVLRHAVTEAALDARDEVILEPGADPGLVGVGSFTGNARLLSLKSDSVEIETESSAPGYVVLAESYAVGWRAAVDGGAAAPVLRANGVFRAVRVPGGRHRVSLRYRPLSVAIGAGLSVVGLLLAVATWSFAAHERGPQGRHGGAQAT